MDKPLTSRNPKNRFLAHYFAPEITKGNSMATVNVAAARGGNARVTVKPDGLDPKNSVYLAVNPPASLTRQQATEVAEALLNVLEGDR